MENFTHWEDVRVTRERIASAITFTPVLTSRTLDRDAGVQLFFKCENLQRTGSFKMRGAANFVYSLMPDQAAHGVATHSSGNHGAALACAAGTLGIPAHIVVPNNAPATKRAQIGRYGGTLRLCEPNYVARQAACNAIIAETGAHLAHSANDERVIAGQATVALELSQQVPDLDVILAPIGGGGLASGLVVGSRSLGLACDIIAVEPAQAQDAYLSWKSGVLHPPDSRTIADGLRVGLAERPLRILRAGATDIILVSESAIAQAMKRLWEVLKIVVEPSGATPYAALLEGRLPARYRRVGIVLSGGNLDLTQIPWVEHPELLAPLQPAGRD
jgi:threonine dehydratase